MKKILALSVAALWTFGIVSNACATDMAGDSQNVTAEYTIGSSYSVTVPAGIVFTSSATSVNETINASNVLIDGDDSLIVSMKSAHGNLINGSSYVPYSFTLGESTTQIAKDTDYLILSAVNGSASVSKEMTFTAGNLDHVTAAGRHADTLTFTISIGEAPEEPAAPSSNILVSNSQYIPGAYYEDGMLRTSGAYGLVKTHEEYITPQKVKLVVEDTNTDYKVVYSTYDSSKTWKSRSSILTVTDGVLELDLPTLAPSASYFKVDVMRYGSVFSNIPTTATITLYSLAEPKSEDPTALKFANKKIDLLGDSITAQGTYINPLKTLTGASTVVNHGISGQTLPNFAGRVTELASDADLIIVFGGTNDYWHKTENIGTISDTSTSTFYGAMNSIYNQLTTNYASAQYLFVFPPHQTFSGSDDTADFGHGTFNDFRVAMQTFCSNKGIKFLDLWTIEDWNPATHTGDGVHPNSTGGAKIANAIHNFIQANF